VNKPWVQVLAWVVTVIIVVLNLFLLWQTFTK
jgi:manganese transport protein